MATAELPIAKPIDRRSAPWPSSHTGPTIVPLAGEQDLSTRRRLAGLLAGAISVDDADVVVDLRLVSFLDASTMGVLAEAGGFLRARHRTLVLRAPSPFGRRVLELGGLGALIETVPAA